MWTPAITSQSEPIFLTYFRYFRHLKQLKMEHRQPSDSHANAWFRLLQEVYLLSNRVTRNPFGPYAVTFHLTWDAPQKKCNYTLGYRSQLFWLACSVLSITPVHLQLLFPLTFTYFLIYLWKNNDPCLIIKINNHCVNIRIHKCQQLPGGTL